jgi:hypothetical protein
VKFTYYAGRVGKTSILKCLKTGKKLTKNDFVGNAQHTEASVSFPLFLPHVILF